ncbi:MAG: hypothetical protein ACTSU2_00310 [Promethearchaeota archaeon]
MPRIRPRACEGELCGVKLMVPPTLTLRRTGAGSTCPPKPKGRRRIPARPTLRFAHRGEPPKYVN